MTMRRADYIVIVQAIKAFRAHFNVGNPDTTTEQNEFLRKYNDETVVEVLCEHFKAHNPAFIKEKFLEQYEK